MDLFPALILLAFAMLAYSLLTFANTLRRRHHDHLIPGHPRTPR